MLHNINMGHTNMFSVVPTTNRAITLIKCPLKVICSDENYGVNEVMHHTNVPIILYTAHPNNSFVTRDY